MKKAQIALFVLLAAALTLTSCETLVRAFAEQTGRNIADALWNRLTNHSADASQRFNINGNPVSDVD